MNKKINPIPSYKEIFHHEEKEEILFFDQLSLWFTEYDGKSYSIALVDILEEENKHVYLIMEQNKNLQKQLLERNNHQIGIRDFYLHSDNQVIKIEQIYREGLTDLIFIESLSDIPEEYLPLKNILL